MYSGYANTTMRDLLDGLKALTKKHMDGTISTNLKGLKTIKRGLLSSTNTIFPAIAFFPLSETIYGYRNGGLYRVDRSVNIELYVKQPRVGDSGTLLRKMAEYVRMMFDSYYDDWQFINDDGDSTVFSYQPSQITYESNIGSDSILQGAILPYTFSSWEQAPDFTLSTTISENDLRSVGEYLHDKLRVDASLSNIKFFFSHASPPIQVGQGVVSSVVETQLSSTRREAGRDNPTGSIDVLTWTKASPFEGSLDLNLETVEKIKDVIQADQHFGGKCSRSYITFIEYGVNAQSSLYASRINIETWMYDTLPQETVLTEPHDVFVEVEDGSLV